MASLAGLIILAISALLFRDALPRAGGSSPLEMRTIAVKWNGPLTVAAAGIILAVEDGSFQQQKLSLKLLAGETDLETARAVADSDQIIGHVSSLGFLQARAAGLPVVAFAASYTANSIRLFALERTRLQTPSDLMGKSISYASMSEVGLVVEALISQNAVQRSLVKVTDAVGAVPRLESGAMDVLPGYLEIEGDQLRRLNIPFQTLDPGAFGVHIPGYVYIMSAQMQARSSAPAEAFLATLFSSWMRADRDPARAAELVAARLGPGTSPQEVAVIMEQQRNLIRPFGARIGELDLSRWQEFQKLLLQRRMIARPVNLREAIDFGLVPDVYRQQSMSLLAH